MSASMNCVFWKSATGWPNCWRSLVYFTASSRQALRTAQRAGADIEASTVEPGHGKAETFAFRADAVGDRHAAIFENQLRGGRSVPAELLFRLAEAEARRVLFDHETR